MSLIPEDQPRYEEMQKVVELYVKNYNATQIARTLGIKRVQVLDHIEEYRKSAVNLELMKERVDELITTMDEHYGILIQKAYEIIDEVDAPEDLEAESRRKGQTMTRSQMLSQKLGAIKTIADLESKRIDILQKSGLLEAADVGDALAEMEEQKALLMNILEEELCKSCRGAVTKRLAAHMHGPVNV